MKKIYSFTLVLLTVFLVACASSVTKDIQVETASDPKVNLKAYKSYAWLGSGSVLNDPEGKWQPSKIDITSDIKFMIDRELRQLNVSEVAPENADVAMSFFTGVDMEAQDLKADPKTKVEIPVNVPKAALIVVAIDTSTGFVIWMGQAVGDVQQGASPEVTKERIEYAITEMFKGK